jgi:hypothetical protein
MGKNEGELGKLKNVLKDNFYTIGVFQVVGQIFSPYYFSIKFLIYENMECE